MFTPLTGIRIVDLSHLLAGPYCSYLLGLMGADVVKVEPPGHGDWTRGMGSDPALNAQGMGLSYLAQNANKRSMTVNLKDPRGVDIVRRLAAGAQVFLENMRPGVIDRLGLGWEPLRKENPALVYCSLSGFGQEGPLSHRPAYDHVIQAMSGLMSINGEPDGEPLKLGAPFIDYASGVNAALAVVSALHEVRRTGRGCFLDVSMLDTILNLFSSHVALYVNAGTQPVRIGNDAPSGITTAGTFPASDGPILIAANAEAHFEPLARTIGRADLIEDARFATPVGRQLNRAALRAEMGNAIAKRTAAEWEEILGAAGVPAARPRTIPEIVDDPHVQARGLVQWLAGDEECRPLGVTGAGFNVDGAAIGPQRWPPALGADTEAVLHELGISDADIATLRHDGVI